MAIKVFLDANVILEAYLGRKEHENASAILNLVADATIEGYTSTSVIQICIYMLEREMSPVQTSRLFLSFLKYVDVVNADKETLVAALTSKAKDLEDAIQYFTALHHGLDCYLSFDQKFGKDFKTILPVQTPGNFLRSRNLG